MILIRKNDDDLHRLGKGPRFIFTITGRMEGFPG